MVMSLHEILLLSVMMSITMSIIWKWYKSLLVIVLLEFLATTLMVSFMVFVGGQLVFMVMVFVFFVGEALILLSSLYSSMRVFGISFSTLVLM